MALIVSDGKSDLIYLNHCPSVHLWAFKWWNPIHQEMETPSKIYIWRLMVPNMYQEGKKVYSSHNDIFFGKNIEGSEPNTNITWGNRILSGWRRLLRVPLTTRRSNQSILKEMNLDIHWKDWCWSWHSNMAT